MNSREGGVTIMISLPETSTPHCGVSPKSLKRGNSILLPLKAHTRLVFRILEGISLIKLRAELSLECWQT